MALVLDQRNTFGSLHTGRDAAKLRPDECPVFRNVQHDIDGRTRKRRGYALAGGVACAPEPDCWHQEAFLDGGGSLTAATSYEVRITHVTYAGETDIIRQPSRVTLMPGSGADSIRLWHPFHMRKMAIAAWLALPSDTAGLPLNPLDTAYTGQDLGLYLGGAFNAVIGVPDETLPPRSIKKGSVAITFQGGVVITDDGAGALTGTGVDTGTIDYATGDVAITWTVEPTGGATSGDWVVVAPGTVYMIRLTAGPPLSILESCPDAFRGFLVYSRAPRIQDQTRLGANYQAAVALYHRIKPLTTVFAFAAYDGTPVFVLAGRVPQIGQMGKVDRDTVDIMMPDRTGLPVLWWNAYISPDTGASAFRWGGTSVHGAQPIVVRAYDTDAARSPLDRITRARPIVTTEPAFDVAPDGAAIPARTGIRGGLKAIRTTWTLSERSIMQAPGWSVAAAQLGLGGRRAPPRGRQETHPSRVAYLEVPDDWQIHVNREAGDLPEYVAGRSIYAADCEPHRILSFAASEQIPADDNLLHHETPAADHCEDGTSLDSIVTPLAGYAEHDDDNAAPTQPATDLAARGTPPAYAQIAPHVEATDGTAAPWRFASSDDDAETNRHRWVFPLDTVTDADDLSLSRHAVLRLFMRVRPGDLTNYNPATAAAVKVRVWWASTSEWRELLVNLGPSGGFVEHNVPIPLDFLTDISSLFSIADDTRRIAMFDIVATDNVGFDYAEPTLRLFRQDDVEGTDMGALEPPSDGEMLQIEDAAEERVSLRNPLAWRSWWNRGIRQDNTATWPLQLFAQPIPRGHGPKGQTIATIVGCADSLFRMRPGGVFERLYQYEGVEYAKVVQDDFQMCSHQWRLFACNPGLSTWNLRWDGQQTWPMGLATPEQKGAVTSIHEPAPGPDVTEDVEIDYWIVYVRTVHGANGYIARSEPFKFTDTVKVNLRDGFESACRIEGTVRPEGQVTQIELYRNLVDTEFPKRAIVIDVTESVVNADGSVRIAVDDIFDGTDGDLDIDINFDTARPPASTMLKFHEGCVHGVAQDDRDRGWYSNVTSPWGLEDPEGCSADNRIAPPIKIASAITALTGEDGPLRISTLKGMARADRVANEDGSEAFNVTVINADTGWVGPRASCGNDSIEYGMTVYGMAMREGDEVRSIKAPAQAILEHAHLDARMAYGSWCEQDPDGRTWFSFSDDAMGLMNGALVLHREKLGDGVEPYWAEWRIKSHSSCIVQSPAGKNVMLLGGSDGRVYRYGGRFATDAGLFIDAVMRSRPESPAGPADSVRYNSVTWWVHGDVLDVVNVAIRKDMDIQQQVNTLLQRIRCNVPPVDSQRNEIPLFGVGAFTPGDGTEYGLPDAHMEIEQPGTMATLFRQIQFEVSQVFSEMPVGTRREASFEVAGYVLKGESVGPQRRR